MPYNLLAKTSANEGIIMLYCNAFIDKLYPSIVDAITVNLTLFYSKVHTLF